MSEIDEEFEKLKSDLKKSIDSYERLDVMERCMTYLNYLGPIVFVMNVPVPIIAALWLLFSNGWQFALCAVCSYVFGPYVIGLLTYSAKLFSGIDDVEISSFLVALVHWVVAMIWGYITIAVGIEYGVLLSLDILPTLALCSAMCTLPFFRVLVDTLRRDKDEAGFICIIITAFVELASIISLLVFSVFFERVEYIHVVVICTFVFVGLFAVPIHCYGLVIIREDTRLMF